MVIDGNPIEKAALEAFQRGDREEAIRIQNEFVAAFQEEYKDKDHCPCTKSCRHHGNCKECVAIHRAHQEHLPVCFKTMVNEKIKSLSELTEHSFAKTLG